MIEFTLGDGSTVEYRPVGRSNLPDHLRWDVPRRYQGQIVEWAFAGIGEAGNQGEGSPYARRTDQSDATTSYYMAVPAVVDPVDVDVLIASIATVRAQADDATAELHNLIAAAAAGGVSERQIAEASGYARPTVGRILRKAANQSEAT